MPRQRQPPSPIAIPPNLASTSSSSIPLASYLALPAPAPTSAGNFFLRLRRSATQLRPVSTSPYAGSALTPPLSPSSPSLLSPTLFPAPPSRTAGEDDDSRPFANLAPRSPTTGQRPWLELPTTGYAPIFSTTIKSSPVEESRWPLTPESPYTPLKEPYAPERHSPSRQGKNLVFPHKPRGGGSHCSPFPPSPPRRRSDDNIEDDSDVDAPLGPSPRRHSTLALPFPSAPRSPSRIGLLLSPNFSPGGTPRTPPSRPRSMIAPSPPPTTALPPIPPDNSLGLELVEPSTPPRSLRTTPRVTPNAPSRPRRVFSDYPAFSSLSPTRRSHFANGPTEPRSMATPLAPSPVPRPASVSSYGSEDSEDERDDFDFSAPSSRNQSFDTSASSVSTHSHDSLCDKQSTLPSLLVTNHVPRPPPRPPRSPLRPASRAITPTPSLLGLRPSYLAAPPHSTEEDDEDEEEEEDDDAIMGRRRRSQLVRPKSTLLLSALDESDSAGKDGSLGTVASKEYYDLVGFAPDRYSTVTSITGLEKGLKFVDGPRTRSRWSHSKGQRNSKIVTLGGLPEQVRENFLRMKFDEEPTMKEEEEELSEGVGSKQETFIANRSEDSLDDEFVLKMMEKMLWG